MRTAYPGRLGWKEPRATEESRNGLGEPGTDGFWIRESCGANRPLAYIRYNDGGEELYDHDSDPNEMTNLAEKSRIQNGYSELGEIVAGGECKIMRVEQDLLIPQRGNTYLFRRNNKRSVVGKIVLTSFPAKRGSSSRDASPIGIRVADNRFCKGGL